MVSQESTRVWIVAFALAAALSSVQPAPEGIDAVLVLDGNNFTEALNKHTFLAVEFYAPVGWRPAPAHPNSPC